MGVYDRYGGAEAWDAECHRRGQAWRAMVHGKYCEDCIHCAIPPKGNKHGWCDYLEDYTELDCSPEKVECDGFE